MATPELSLDYPPSLLPVTVRQNLLLELSLINHVTHRDWRGLADLLGFPNIAIRLLEQQNMSGDLTWQARTVIERWEATSRNQNKPNSLRVFIAALDIVGLQNCIDTLEEHFKGCVDVKAVASEVKSKYKSNTELKSALFPVLDRCDVFPPSDMRRSPTAATTPGEVSSIPLAQSVTPLSPMQPENQFSVAMEPHQEGCNSEPVGAQAANSTSTDPKHSSSELIPNSVYISYHPSESRESRKAIDTLANHLRVYDFTVYYDRFCEQDIKKQTKTGWKEWAITHADKILVICTSKYLQDDAKYTSPDCSKRRKNDLAIDSQLLRDITYYGSSARLLPVVLLKDVKGEKGSNEYLPHWLRALRYYKWPDGENEDLILCLKGMPKYTLPPITQRRKVRPKQIYFANAPKWDPYDIPQHRRA